MPYDITQGGGSCGDSQWAVVLRRTGRTMGCHDTRDDAERQVAALNANEAQDAAMPDLTINGQPVDEATARSLLDTALAPASGDAMPTTTVATLVEARSGALLVEQAGEPGRALVKIIGPGRGSSGIYTSDVLERDGPAVFTAGMHMYWDHPTLTEQQERPERSLRDLAAVLSEDARWDANGPEGPGLYARAQVFGPYRDALAQLAEHIGVSIRAAGRVERGDDGPVITALEQAHSVDFVTHAGAGGEVVELFEAARPSEVAEARNAADWIEVEIHRGVMGLVNAMWGEGGTLTREEWEALNAAVVAAMDSFRATLRQQAPQLEDRDPIEQVIDQQVAMTDADLSPTPTEAAPETATEESAMPDQTAEQLSEQVATLTSERDQLQTQLTEATTRAERAEDALRIREARDVAAAVLDEHAADLPARARQRVVESCVADPPTSEDGSLDRDSLTERVQTAAGEERAYLAEATGSTGRPTGVGDPASTTTSGGPVTVEDYQAMGLSEADAKAAARIHA